MPQNNKAINKYLREDPARKDYIQLVNDEFNDARSQIIKRLFDQTALYNDIDYKLRPSKDNKIGETVVEFNIQALINDLKNEIDTAGDKLNAESKSLVGKIDIQEKYNKVISSLSAYANTVSADPENIKSFKLSITMLAPNIKKLLFRLQGTSAAIIDFIRSVNRNEIQITPEIRQTIPKMKSDLKQILRYFILYSYLYERMESGYNQGQYFELKNLASLNIPDNRLSAEALKVENMLRNLPVPSNRPQDLIPFIPNIPPAPAPIPNRLPIIPPNQGNLVPLVPIIPAVGQGKNKKLGIKKTIVESLDNFPHQSAHHELILKNPASRVNTKTEGNGHVNVRTEANGKKKTKKRCQPKFEDI